MANKHKFTKTEFRLAMENSGGNIGFIAHRLNVARRTVYRYLEKYPELDNVLKQERQSGRDEIVEIAKSKLLEGVMTGNERLVMFALRHYDKDGVPGAVDLGSLFAPDVVELMKSQGIEASDVVKEFEAMMRAEAAKVRS